MNKKINKRLTLWLKVMLVWNFLAAFGCYFIGEMLHAIWSMLLALLFVMMLSSNRNNTSAEDMK